MERIAEMIRHGSLFYDVLAGIVFCYVGALLRAGMRSK